MWLWQAYHQKARQQQQAVIQLDEQEAIIESLQNDLVSLSIQTEDMQAKMKSLETLEQEINQLTGSSEPEAAVSRKSDFAGKRESVKLASRSGAPAQEYYRHGPVQATVGGEAYGTSPEDIRALADRTATSLDTLHNLAVSMKHRLKEARSIAEAYQEKMRATPSIWPTESKRITSEFGHRQDPFTKRKSFHSGIDIAGEYNDPVYAATVFTEGTLTILSTGSLNGNCEAATLIIEEGGTFNGRSSMSPNEALSGKTKKMDNPPKEATATN